MADGKTWGEVLNEIFNEMKAHLGDALDRPAHEDWIKYSISFNSKLRDDAPPWVGIDHSG